MEDYFKLDEWKIIEEGFKPGENRFTESIMSLGNGHMGMRGNFEEKYSGDSLQGTYIAGVYYPDKTVVGWWKVGYPEYYAKVPNATNFIGIDVRINGEELDLACWQINSFRRELNMEQGFLKRTFTAENDAGVQVAVSVRRFLSMARREIGAVSYSITPLNQEIELELVPYLDGTITNEDANYGEVFWKASLSKAETGEGEPAGRSCLALRTKKSDFLVAAAMEYKLNKHPVEITACQEKKYVDNSIFLTAKPGEENNLTKYIGVTTNRDYPDDDTITQARSRAREARNAGWQKLFAEHSRAWKDIWDEGDIRIEGDAAAQQGIRFNIFHLNQTYTGHDPRLNIGPKGFTGEKYGGATYWDTEAYCLPFYLNTRDNEIARNLLLYRYRHLEKARENADKLGLDGALYPMVTMNGEECHNEWEITFEEIHRNAAIVYAIYNYVQYTEDNEYLADYGLEVIAEVARFWEDRAHFNPRKNKYMILGVTGPNEYENNVHNNWYTNRMAAWCLEYALETINYLKDEYPGIFQKLWNELGLSAGELEKWRDMIDKMYYPYVEDLEVFEQQDGYMDKELKTVAEIPEEDLPLHQNWSWDRILRSCYVKQADVLQGLYFLSDCYDLATKKLNFDFYEPRTVHESSLSPCVYSIIAAEIGYQEKAYELYLRTARLDLENVNKDTEDGLHITSMAGTWMSIVHGFAGMKLKRIAGEKKEGRILSLEPFIPEKWKSYSFKINYRGRILNIKVTSTGTRVNREQGEPLKILLEGEKKKI